MGWALLAAVAMAGCATAPLPPPSLATMTLRGAVVDDAIHPIAGANVLLLEAHAATTTDGHGIFTFQGLTANTYTLLVQTPTYATQLLKVTPQDALHQVNVVMASLAPPEPYHVTVSYHGIVQCALEAFIISPSCDTLLNATGGPTPFTTDNSILLPVDSTWRTVVADVVFDPNREPLTQGLRVTVQGTGDQSRLGIYEQYGRFNATGPFTFRLDPGATYPEGAKPVPLNTTQFRFEIFPQSYLWHQTCSTPAPPAAPCLLGVGAGTDVQFDLYLTTFYGLQAPDGFTLRG
ncbi:MAG: carboxypeptidase regulatory-like domain-containing protein [Thermoplasmatota archaeon]